MKADVVSPMRLQRIAESTPGVNVSVPQYSQAVVNVNNKPRLLNVKAQLEEAIKRKTAELKALQVQLDELNRRLV